MADSVAAFIKLREKYLLYRGRGSLSSKHQPALGFRDGPPEFARGFQPLGDHDFGVGKGFLPRAAVGRAASQFRHFRDKRLILVAPVQDDLVFGHSAPSASLY